MARAALEPSGVFIYRIKLSGTAGAAHRGCIGVLRHEVCENTKFKEHNILTKFAANHPRNNKAANIALSYALSV